MTLLVFQCSGPPPAPATHCHPKPHSTGGGEASRPSSEELTQRLTPAHAEHPRHPKPHTPFLVHPPGHTLTWYN